MGIDPTQQINQQGTVNYRCVCGVDLRLDLDQGGQCPSCNKVIAAKVLRHDLSLTIAVPVSNVDLQATRLAGQENTAVQNANLPDDAWVGKRYGHFELQAPLGQGGMGQVFRALDMSLQRYVAVKILRHEGGGLATASQSDVVVDKLLMEAVSQARVNHPNIVAIYYVGREQGHPFLAMELVPGRTLASRISSGALGFDEIANIAIQISEALRFSHELDVIHGDIKPSNILLQPNGVAKLSDFGMARRASSDKVAGLGGTPNYLAPELLEGSLPTIQSDMYALGVTLFEMTFERLPVELSGSSIDDWARSHKARKIEFPSPWPEKYPVEWRTILLRLLNQDPSKRYQSYELLLRDLYRVMPVKSQTARPLPRMIAAIIDYSIVGIAFFAVMLLVYFLEQMFLGWLSVGKSNWLSRLDEDLPWYLDLARITANLVFSFSGFGAILLYSAWVGFWRQSLGRALMHLRVYNKYGLPPSARLLVTRDALRMLPFWILPLIIFVQTNGIWTVALTVILISVTAMFWLVDAAYCLFSPKGMAIHDRLLETAVVLDTDAGF